MSDLRDQICPSWCVLLARHDGPHRPVGSDQSDMHRTGCGCAQCGPARRDPMTFEDDETHQLRLERDELQRVLAAEREAHARTREQLADALSPQPGRIREGLAR